jgi:hypothetical protein
MVLPLRPVGTAYWLISRTPLTDRQIARFTGLSQHDVAGLRRAGDGRGAVAFDPVAIGLLTFEEIDRCAADDSADLRSSEATVRMPGARRPAA